MAALVLLLAAGGAWVVSGQHYYEDEYHHYSQIRRFLNGNITELGGTMVPGYHVVLTALGSLTGVVSLDGMRRFTLVFSLLSALVFYFTRKRLSPATAPIRTLQFFALPILFPLFFMVYTDSLHLLLLLLSVAAYTSGRFGLAGVMAGLCLLVRQSNVVWVAMLFVMIYVDQNGFVLNRTAIGKHLRRCWVFLVDFAVFVAFVVWNGGVAVGLAKHQHQAWPPHAENAFFAMIVLFFLLLPSHAGRLPAIRDLLRRVPLVSVAVAAAFLAFMLDFAADHPWNVDEPFYLRNRLLDWIKSSALIKAVAFIPIGLALLSLGATQLLRRSMLLLYPFWILSLLPVAVIAPRYQIIPLVLLLLFKAEEDSKVEWLTFAYLLLLTAVLSPGVFAHQYTL